MRETTGSGFLGESRASGAAGLGIWLGLAAALGTGLFSIPCVAAVLNSLGVTVGASGFSRFPLLTGPVVLLLAAAWFGGAWWVIRKEWGAGTREMRLLAIVVFAGTVSWLILHLLNVIEDGMESPYSSPLSGVLELGSVVLVFFLPGVVFAIMQPRHGIFYAALATAMLVDIGPRIDPVLHALPLCAKMAIVFLYVSGGRVVQKATAWVIVAAGLAGLPGCADGGGHIYNYPAFYLGYLALPGPMIAIVAPRLWKVLQTGEAQRDGKKNEEDERSETVETVP